ncbi:MAG TPA: FkbM family methyltransferase [Steroidobacteraceae bacterium]|nr:FkbM family methyltransferase [Steroidobacteraceae bacterium]
MRNHYLKRLSRRLRAQWRAKSLGEHAIAIVAETKNGRLCVHVGDFNVSRSLLENGEYDWPEISWLKQLLDAKSRVVFAGAHIGAVLIPLARISGTRSIVAYEPSPRNFRLLNMNLALNQVEGVATLNTALGDRTGKIQFTENSINTGNSRVASADGEITVNLDTLDRTIPAGWDSIDLIVMDTEGSEVAVMRGAQLSLARAKNLYVEFSPEQLREQGSSAIEFVATVEKYFKSAYVFGNPIVFLGPEKFAEHLKGLQHHRGLLLNVLFTQDFAANPQRMSSPSNL